MLSSNSLNKCKGVHPKNIGRKLLHKVIKVQNSKSASNFAFFILIFKIKYCNYQRTGRIKRLKSNDYLQLRFLSPCLLSEYLWGFILICHNSYKTSWTFKYVRNHLQYQQVCLFRMLYCSGSEIQIRHSFPSLYWQILNSGNSTSLCIPTERSFPVKFQACVVQS